MVIDIELTLNKFGFGKIAENKFQLFWLRFSKWKIPNKHSIDLGRKNDYKLNWCGDKNVIYCKSMIQNYIENYLNKAQYEMIDGGKKFYAEIKNLRGVWATGKTLEECRRNLANTIEGWLILRLKKNLTIPNFKVPSVRLKV